MTTADAVGERLSKVLGDAPTVSCVPREKTASSLEATDSSPVRGEKRKRNMVLSRL